MHLYHVLKHPYVSMCVWWDRAWQNMQHRQLKLFINALLDNAQANPIIWQAVIRALAACRQSAGS